MYSCDIPTPRIVAGLLRLQAYPEAPPSVTSIETHMSWVFLAGAHVYKLKKAIRHDELDFSSPELRRRNCLEEVRLNRRLAPDVYHGVVPVTSANGCIAVDGEGAVVDWLVHMRRLPAERSLEAVLLAGHAAAEEAVIRGAAQHLARFYSGAAPERQQSVAFRARLADGVRGDQDVLLQSRYGLDTAKVTALAEAELDVLDRCAAGFDRRVEQGRIVEGHGDLRPEHLWLETSSPIIDCVEFDRALRVVDPADELAFLGLECDRLGSPDVGRWFLDTYIEVTADRPPEWLLAFYRVYRALRRATIAARHLDDPSVADAGRFRERARLYLAMAEPLARDAGCMRS
jgi:aminoglycoside phosphotransferase family enzyme